MVQVFHAEEIGMRPKLAAFAAREADVVVAVSSYTASLVRGLGSTRASMRLIPPGVDLPADPTPSLAEQPTVLTVARMEERYKGHDMIVRAWPLVRSRLPGARWIVIGDGRLRRPTEALVASYGIADSVSFLGELDDGERDAWLRRAHLLAMPSRLPGGAYSGEGFGIAYLEAGAFRKPVVAGNVGGALDSVADGESGLLVDPTDPVAVAQAISRLLLDPVLAARLGDGGRARAERLSWSAMTARMRDVLLETIGRAGADAAGA
jgi:phosphatidylinositol alpha-1,6-mannosyltransferase